MEFMLTLGDILGMAWWTFLMFLLGALVVLGVIFHKPLIKLWKSIVRSLKGRRKE